jgi:hypothetical protein
MRYEQTPLSHWYDRLPDEVYRLREKIAARMIREGIATTQLGDHQPPEEPSRVRTTSFNHAPLKASAPETITQTER